MKSHGHGIFSSNRSWSDCLGPYIHQTNGLLPPKCNGWKVHSHIQQSQTTDVVCNASMIAEIYFRYTRNHALRRCLGVLLWSCHWIRRLRQCAYQHEGLKCGQNTEFFWCNTLDTVTLAPWFEPLLNRPCRFSVAFKLVSLLRCMWLNGTLVCAGISSLATHMWRLWNVWKRNPIPNLWHVCISMYEL